MAKLNHRIAWVGAASIVVGSVAGAQKTTPCTVPVALGAISLAPIPKVGTPYSATVKTTRDQVLDNGRVIHASVTTHQARDAAGRLFSEESFGCQPGVDGESHPVFRRFITDPGNGTTISWEVGDPLKVLRVSREPARIARAQSPTTKEQSPEDNHRDFEELGMDLGVDLGSKKIAGVMAEGNRTAGTTPAGHKLVNETWRSKDLQLEMLRITDNSRTGRTTVEVVDLEQGDPDSVLFAPPVGYKNGDNNPKQ
jgi:hypothetical protein